jgi:Protein of unknown function (DUF3467)
MPTESPAEVIKNPNSTVVTFYSNSANIDVTPWDFKILFGEITKIERQGEMGGQIFVDDKVRVTMSPQHAKALMNVLRTNIEQYEAKLGSIPSIPA